VQAARDNQKVSKTKFISFLNNSFIFKRNLSRGLPILTDAPVKFYENALEQRRQIMLENRDKAFVYRWTNKINGKTYLGSTSNAKKRLNFYFDKGSISNRRMPIYLALLKYGYENFTFEVIKYCKPEEAVKLEQKYLDKYDFDYNINAQANTTLGYKHTAETLAKFKGRQPFKGKTHSEETKQSWRENGAKKRIDKQLNSKINLKDLFSQFSQTNDIITCNKNDIITSVSDSVEIRKKSKSKKFVRITDISNNKSIVFSSVSSAGFVLCCWDSVIVNYEKDNRLFSYFERDLLNNCLIERKLLITFEKNI
jgi:group I intron endonuclease